MRSIYLAGKMDGLSEQEAMSWRRKVLYELQITDKLFKVNYPPYGYEEHKNLMWDRDYFLLDKSDILLVNFDYEENSPFLGTSMEIGRAYYQRKPIVIFSSKQWVHESKTLQYHATAIVNTLEEAIEIICELA